MSKRSEKKSGGKDKPIVKVPKGKLGRAAFTGTQVFGAVSAARAIRTARKKGDKLALVHGALSAAVLVVSTLIAIRTARAADHPADAADSAPAEPLALAPGK